MEKTNNKKRYGVIAVVLVALLAAGVGTWAWLQATDTKVNEFTVGNIGKPEVKPDPDHPDKPGVNPTDPKVDGYLFETKWVKDSKMIPNTDINNNLAKTPYFTLNTNWKPVDGQVTKNADGQYVSGLFMYTAGGTGQPVQLTPAGDKAAYTGELFSTVHIPAAMNNTDVVEKPAMTVSCYIFGADQGGAANAVEQAKAWANSPEGPANK